MKRADYMTGKISFDDYYLALARKMGIKPSEKIVRRAVEALRKGDNHLNSIPLGEWDTWALSLYAFRKNEIDFIFRQFGDFYSLAGLVCVLKAVVRYEAEKILQGAENGNS